MALAWVGVSRLRVADRRWGSGKCPETERLTRHHGDMRYVLLTWNPGPKDEEQYTPEQWRDEMVVPLRDGRPPDGDRWSIGTNWKIIQAGDMACMFRQGVHGRGIVATGLITRGAFRASHWNPYKTGDTWYVNVAWNRAFDLNQMITIDELAREVPGFAWNRVYSSGRIVDGSPGTCQAG